MPRPGAQVGNFLQYETNYTPENDGAQLKERISPFKPNITIRLKVANASFF